MFVFQKMQRALFSCNHRFEIRPFALLPSNCGEYAPFQENGVTYHTTIVVKAKSDPTYTFQ